MYCQFCGEEIENMAAKKCQQCGRVIVKPSRGFHWRALFLLVVLALVVGGIYISRQSTADTPAVAESSGSEPVDIDQRGPNSADPEAALGAAQISLPNSYELPVSLGDIGPKLLAEGAIDLDRFVQTYERAGQALTEAESAILIEGSNAPVFIDKDNAYFLLNFLWAFGLTNQNPLLEEGPLMQYSESNIGRFASTGGWTLGTRPADDLYSSASLVSLTSEQQARLENVAFNVYRPCCNNHTAFADCNHGMAMLGLLELMAGQGASEDKMFEAAKYVNTFWFPEQAFETAAFFQATMDIGYDEVDSRMAVGSEVFAGSGFQSVREWLATNGALDQAPSGGGGCGV